MPRARKNHDGLNMGGRGQRQPYHMTCSNCRKRKIKCDGGRPQCGICLAYSEQCYYDRMPSMSQIQAMADRITELERALKQSNEAMDTPSAVSDGPHPPVDSVTPTSLAQSPWFSSTSAVHDPMASTDSLVSMTLSSHPSNYQSLSMSPEQLLFWEDAALNVCATLLNLPASVVKHLLLTHWCWVQPTFWFVTQSTFMRDAAAGGPSFSHLLLCVICLHSTRLTEHNLSGDLLARTQLLLGHDIHKSPSIPTLQALLLLSAREIGSGSLSQAWLYSGMAFRMVIDIGIYSASSKPPSSSEEHQIRQRLAWSCFLWDKAMSLYLGRVPTLPNAPDFDPPSPDTLLDTSIWCPYFGNGLDKLAERRCVSYMSCCFNNFCKLVVIINDILLTIYNSHRKPLIEASFLHNTKQRLDKWREESPSYLVIHRTDETCPPPHILTQNLLFHTALILLHRPFRQNKACQQVCQDAADNIEHSLTILDKSFGFAHTTYLIAYCAYTAATVALQDLKACVAGAHGRLNTYLRALHGVRRSCPGIQRSIDMIIKHMSSSAVRTGDELLNSPQNVQEANSECLPAFPFNTAEDLYEPVNGHPEGLQFGSLDLFAHEWSSISDDQLNMFLSPISTSLLESS